MPICAACQPLQKKHDDLLKQIQDIQNGPCYIQTASGACKGANPGKPDPEALAEVKKLWTEVAQVNQQFDQCMITKCGGLPDLLATFTGTPTLTTSDPSYPGPYQTKQPVSFTLLFHKWDHKQVDIPDGGFPPIVVPTNGVTINVTKTGGGNGSFDPGSGILALSVTLHFGLPVVPDSDITWNLSTENPGGARVSVALLGPSTVTLAASAVFQGGHLGGDVGTITLAGTLFPSPRPLIIEPA